MSSTADGDRVQETAAGDVPTQASESAAREPVERGMTAQPLAPPAPQTEQPEQATPPWPAGERLIEVDARLAELLAAISALKTSFETKAAEDDVNRRILDELHGYKEEHVFRHVLRPVFMDLILVHDRASTLRLDLAAAGSTAPELLDSLGSFADEIQHVLERQSVRLIETGTPAFDPRRQEAVELEYTDDKQLDRTVARVVKRGFEYYGRTVVQLRPEQVIVRKFRASPEEKKERRNG